MVLSRKQYYGKQNHPAPIGWIKPFVHPKECDHEIDLECPNALCVQCCPCDLCGVDRGV